MSEESFLRYLLKQIRISEEEFLEFIKPQLIEQHYLKEEEFSQFQGEFQSKRTTLNNETQNELLKQLNQVEKETIGDDTVSEESKTRLPKTVLNETKTVSLFTPQENNSKNNFQTIEERYQILDILGSGGMGIVQRAQDCLLGREVALKRIRMKSAINLPTTQRHIIWRLQREAEITAVLEHPNIIPLYDMEKSADGDLCFTMQKVEGETLREIIRQQGQENQNFKGEKQLPIFFKICDALAYAHNSGVIHRDIKPDNVMVGQFGEVYVMDWGIAKKLSSAIKTNQSPMEKLAIKIPEILSENETMGALGTPGYMPPEQKTNPSNVTPSSDIYALGKLLRECYTGYSPQEELHYQMKQNENFMKGKALNRKQIQKDLFGEKIPIDVQAIIQKATAEDPSQRYQKVQELVFDLECFQQNRQVSARTYSRSERLLKWSERHSNEILFRFMTFFLSLLLFYALQIYQEKVIKEKQTDEKTQTEKNIQFRKQLAKREEQRKSQNNENEILRLQAFEASLDENKKPYLIWQKALQDPHWLIRYRAAEQLKLYPQQAKEFLPSLFETLLDKNEYVRYAVACTIVQLKFPTTMLVELSLQLLPEETNQDLEFWLLWIFKHKKNNELLEKISQQAIKGIHWKNRQKALELLQELDEQKKYIPTFIQALKDPSKKVQWTAVICLQELTPKQQTPHILKELSQYQQSMGQLDSIAFVAKTTEDLAETAPVDEVQLDRIEVLKYVLLLFLLSQILAILKEPLETKIVKSKIFQKCFMLLSQCFSWCQKKGSSFIKLESLFRNFFLLLSLSTLFISSLFILYSLLVSGIPPQEIDYIEISLSIFLELLNIGFSLLFLIVLFEATAICTVKMSVPQLEETKKLTFQEGLNLFAQQYSIVARTLWLIFFLMVLVSSLTDKNLAEGLDHLITLLILAASIHIAILSKYPILFATIFTILVTLFSSLYSLWNSTLAYQHEFEIFLKILFNSAYLGLSFLNAVVMFEIASSYSYYTATQLQKEKDTLFFKNRFKILFSQYGLFKKLLWLLLFTLITTGIYLYTTDFYTFFDYISTLLVSMLCLHLFFSKLKIAKNDKENHQL